MEGTKRYLLKSGLQRNLHKRPCVATPQIYFVSFRVQPTFATRCVSAKTHTRTRVVSIPLTITISNTCKVRRKRGIMPMSSSRPELYNSRLSTVGICALPDSLSQERSEPRLSALAPSYVTQGEGHAPRRSLGTGRPSGSEGKPDKS